MWVSDICARNAAVIGLSATAREAAWKMGERQTGLLIVVAQGEARPVGIVTDRDLVLKVLARGASPDELTVGEIMTRDVGTCRYSDDLFVVAQTMARYGVRRLPVVDEVGAVAGLVSADDIYAALSAHMKELARAFAREHLHELESIAR